MAATLALDPAVFVTPIGRAVRRDRLTELAETLATLTKSGTFDDPDLFPPSREERHARRLLWKDPENRFVVAAMTWFPGQRSPLHDHAGLWGAEIVIHGAMRETPYRLMERDTDCRYFFVREEDVLHHRGDVGILLAPREYHEFGNAGSTVAHTIHVYGGEINRCTTLVAEGDGWWRGQDAMLGYDA